MHLFFRLLIIDILNVTSVDYITILAAVNALFMLIYAYFVADVPKYGTSI